MQDTTEPRDLEGRIEELAAAIRTVKEMGRRHALAIVEAGRLGKEVKEELLMSPEDIGEYGAESWNASGQRVPRPINQGLTEFSPETGQSDTAEKCGWQALCEGRLGVSYKTADRYIEDFEAWEELRALAERQGTRVAARAQAFLELVECGELRATPALEALEAGDDEAPTEPPDPKQWAHLLRTLHDEGERRRYFTMEEAALAGDVLAAQNLMAAARGEVSIRRAYAGWQGGRATRGKARRDPDYGRIYIQTARSARRGWKQWEALEASRRAEILDEWEAMMRDEYCPQEMRVRMAKVVHELEDWA